MKQYAAGEWPNKPERDKRDPGKTDKRRKEPLGMTKENYLAALSELGLAPQARQTAKLLGLSLRACQRFALGEQQVPDTVALLLGMYRRHGLP